jgi:hypothetical protein
VGKKATAASVESATRRGTAMRPVMVTRVMAMRPVMVTRVMATATQ